MQQPKAEKMPQLKNVPAIPPLQSVISKFQTRKYQTGLKLPPAGQKKKKSKTSMKQG